MHDGGLAPNKFDAIDQRHRESVVEQAVGAPRGRDPPRHAVDKQQQVVVVVVDRRPVDAGVAVREGLALLQLDAGQQGDGLGERGDPVGPELLGGQHVGERRDIAERRRGQPRRSDGNLEQSVELKVQQRVELGRRRRGGGRARREQDRNGSDRRSACHACGVVAKDDRC
jgi:hypothetical protein